MPTDDRAVLKEALREFRLNKALAERALAQVSDADFFATLDDEANSPAVLVKHLGGNLRSRWTDFLTTDGEKPDRNRDAEFVVEPGDTRAKLMEGWEAGFQTMVRSVEPLTSQDLARTVHIRGEPYTVLRAILRQLGHYAHHVGQIVLLAKHFAGPRWETLTIPRGKSAQFSAATQGAGSTPAARKT